MRTVSIALSLCVLILALGCKSSDPHAATSPSPVANGAGSPPVAAASPSPITLKSRIDPCTLLTSDELKTIQGEALRTAIPSERETSKLIIAQCYYELPATTKSVVVNVTTAKERGTSFKEIWRDTQPVNVGGGQPAGAAHKGSPEKVSGLGDDAYWVETAGALYVLKKEAILRIGIGGADDSQTKLEKLKTLAQKALARI